MKNSLKSCQAVAWPVEVDSVDQADQRLPAPVLLFVRATMLQPRVPVEDSDDFGQVDGHPVHQVEPNRPNREKDMMKRL